MPNPLSRVRRNQRTKVILDDDALHFRPALATLLGRIVAVWAYVDEKTGELLAALMGTQASVGVAIYSALSGAEARRAVLRATAAETLSGDDLELFRAVMKLTRSLGDQRNDLVHDLWAYADELPDALLRVPAKAHLPVAAKRLTNVGREFWDKIQVYTARDFEDLLGRCQELHIHLADLTALLRLPPEQREPYRHQLARVPEIRESMSRKTDSENTPPAQPQSPPPPAEPGE